MHASSVPVEPTFLFPGPKLSPLFVLFTIPSDLFRARRGGAVVTAFVRPEYISRWAHASSGHGNACLLSWAHAQSRNRTWEGVLGPPHLPHHHQWMACRYIVAKPAAAADFSTPDAVAAGVGAAFISSDEIVKYDGKTAGFDADAAEFNGAYKDLTIGITGLYKEPGLGVTQANRFGVASPEYSEYPACSFLLQIMPASLRKRLRLHL